MYRKYKSGTAFLDMIFLCLMGFIALYILQLFLIKEESKKAQNLESKSEFVLTMTWSDESHSDVDFWVEDGIGNLVSFKSREKGLLHLERDDLGWKNDVVDTPQGRIVLKDNTELVHIRGIIPGEVIMNAHMYNMWAEDKSPVKVKIKVEKMNPYSVVLINEVALASTGDEKTLGRFTIKNDGTAHKVNFLFKKLTTGVSRGRTFP